MENKERLKEAEKEFKRREKISRIHSPEHAGGRDRVVRKVFSREKRNDKVPFSHQKGNIVSHRAQTVGSRQTRIEMAARSARDHQNLHKIPDFSGVLRVSREIEIRRPTDIM